MRPPDHFPGPALGIEAGGRRIDLVNQQVELDETEGAGAGGAGLDHGRRHMGELEADDEVRGREIDGREPARAMRAEIESELARGRNRRLGRGSCGCFDQAGRSNRDRRAGHSPAEGGLGHRAAALVAGAHEEDPEHPCNGTLTCMARSLRRRVNSLGVAAWVLVAAAVYLALFVAREADAAMGGQLQRIFYFHVPSAWVSYLAFALVFLASIVYLRTGARQWDLLAHSAAEIGVVFCTLVLITGPIWARPVWGTYWQWDARLTSSLIMWLTYVGYLLLRSLASDPGRIGRLAAVVGIVGFVNVPIVHFSVRWWRTLHPSGPTPADPSTASGLGAPELLAFFVALAAFTLLFAWLLTLRIRLGRTADEVTKLDLISARA
jgi:heme exporter protein C